jgi:hypothetical protein
MEIIIITEIKYIFKMSLPLQIARHEEPKEG